MTGRGSKNRFLSSVVFVTGSYARMGLFLILLLYLGIILLYALSLNLSESELRQQLSQYSRTTNASISSTLGGIVKSLSRDLNNLEKQDSSHVHQYVQKISNDPDRGYLSTAFNWESDSLQIRYAYCQNGELLRSDRIPLAESHPYYQEIRKDGKARITPPYTDQVCHDKGSQALVVSVVVPLTDAQGSYRGMVLADFDLQGFLEKLLPDTGSFQASFVWQDGADSYQQLSSSGALSRWQGEDVQFSDLYFLPPGVGGPFDIEQASQFQSGGYGYYFYPFEKKDLESLEARMGILLVLEQAPATFRWEWVLLATLLLLPFLAFIGFADRQQQRILREIRSFSTLVYAANDEQELIEQVFAFLKNWNPSCHMVVMAELQDTEGKISFVAEEYAEQNRINIRSLEDFSGQAARTFQLDDPQIAWRPFVQCMQMGKNLFFDDYTRYLRQKAKGANVPEEGVTPGSLVVVPIRNGEGQVAGAFSMQSKDKKAFSPRDAFLLEKLGGVALLTLSKLRTFQELRNSLALQLSLNVEKEQALDALERMQKQQNELYLLFLHQIRSFPIKVNDLLQVLQQEENHLLPQPVQMIHDLTTRINDFFAAFAPYLRSEIQELPLRPEFLNLPKVLENVWLQYQPLSREKNLTFACKGEPKLRAFVDPLYLKAILQVLVHNAIKYSPTEGKVSLVYQKEEDCIQIRVLDQGPCAPPNKLQLLNEMLEKAHFPKEMERSDSEGLGLGLFLSAKLAKKIGARLCLKKLPEGGCQAILSLTQNPRK